MFNLNDTILYGSHGVCTIVDICKKDFCGDQLEYYTLKPVYDNNASVIFVPTKNTDLTDKMRQILSAAEVHALIHSMPDEQFIWIENENERKMAYADIIRRGDRQELIQLIKTLHQHQENQKANGKKLYVSDENFFREAEKLLYEEFAYVLHLQQDQVLPFILDQIQIEEKNPKLLI